MDGEPAVGTALSGDYRQVLKTRKGDLQGAQKDTEINEACSCHQDAFNLEVKSYIQLITFNKSCDLTVNSGTQHEKM